MAGGRCPPDPPEYLGQEEGRNVSGAAAAESIKAEIRARIAAEIASAAPGGDPVRARELAAFEAAVIEPFPTTVNFSGGFQQTCWSVTRSDGAYRVVYMPKAEYFALTVESDFGPLDIGVHGPAMGCFASV